MTTLYLDVPADQRIRIDVNGLRVLARYVNVENARGSLEVDAVDLDTGGAQAILGPWSAVAHLFEEVAQEDGQVMTAGGVVTTRVILVTLTVGHWTLHNLELHASEAFTRWLIGMPVLRHLDLLLREDRPEGAWLCGPPPGLVATTPRRPSRRPAL